MKYCQGVIIAFSFLAGALAASINSSELDKLYSRLAALEEKDQLRNIHQQQQDILISKLQSEINHERQLRTNIEKELTKLKHQYAIQTEGLLHKRQGFMETAAFHATLDQDSGLEHINVGSTIPFPNVKLNIGGGYDNTTSIHIHSYNARETAAFHATLDQDSGLEHINVGSTIPFPNVKLNIGGGYENTTSTFTATMPGLYIFSVSITSYWNDHGKLHVGVMKTGVYLAGTYVNDIGGPAEQGSVTIPMQLQTGDKVWIKHVVHDDGALYGGGLTSFMGCLVFVL
ncbi:hypothetical protein ACF0H5_004060 [Mactra antiquata]